MYKTCVYKSNYIEDTYKDLKARLEDKYSILGFDGIQWTIYSLTIGRTPRHVWHVSDSINRYGDIVIQKLIDDGKLVVVQDLLKEEYEIQMALGTVIPRPLKYCTVSRMVEYIRAIL